MTNSDIIKIYRGLSHLVEPADSEGNPVKPYSFSGLTSEIIVKNLKRAKRAVESFDETRNLIIKGLLAEGEKSIPADDERFVQFQQKVTEVLNAEAEFTPHKLKLSDLGLATNRIQPSVQLAIDALIEEEDEPAEV